MLALAACSKSSNRAVERLAILPFENLTGDPALNWIASAGASIVATEISGAANLLPLRLDSLNEAYRSRATRFVHGYFTGRESALHLEVAVEDASTHKTVATMARDGNILTASQGVASELDKGARAFSTSNEAAVAAWGRADFQQATMLDPDFGAAWLGWAQKLATEGNTPQAIDVLSQALQRPSLRSDFDRAQIALASATLRKDNDARRNALIAMAKLSKNDTSLLEALAQIEFAARRFPEAAERYREFLRADPGNVAAMNSLGYAMAYAGRLDEAQRAFEDYGKQPEQKPNSLDSMGEGYFVNGKFDQAEKYFFDAQDADTSRVTGGSELMKAAYARFLAGNLGAADATFKRYLDFRRQLHDPVLNWRQAVWEYSTGRSQQAISRLENVPEGERTLADRQIAVWRGQATLPKDVASLKDLYERSTPTADGVVRTLYAVALMEAGRKDEAKALLNLWPLPEAGGEPLLHSLVYPKFLELRRQTGLSLPVI